MMKQPHSNSPIVLLYDSWHRSMLASLAKREISFFPNTLFCREKYGSELTIFRPQFDAIGKAELSSFSELPALDWARPHFIRHQLSLLEDPGLLKRIDTLLILPLYFPSGYKELLGQFHAGARTLLLYFSQIPRQSNAEFLRERERQYLDWQRQVVDNQLSDADLQFQQRLSMEHDLKKNPNRSEPILHWIIKQIQPYHSQNQWHSFYLLPETRSVCHNLQNLSFYIYQKFFEL